MFGVVCALWVLYKIQRSPKPIDFVDLVLDESGKASWTRMCAIGVFLFSTWIMGHLELTGRMTEGYIGLYLGTFVGGAVAYQFRRRDTVDGPQDVRVQAPANASVSVTSGPQAGSQS